MVMFFLEEGETPTDASFVLGSGATGTSDPGVKPRVQRVGRGLSVKTP